MPKIREVSSLQTFCIKSVSALVLDLSSRLAAKSEDVPQYLERNIDNLKETLISYVNWYIHDSVAVDVMQSIARFINVEKNVQHFKGATKVYLVEREVAIRLVEAVVNPKLRHVDFSRWPEPIRHILYRNITKMVGLVTLTLRSIGGYNTNILAGFKTMTNLRSVSLHLECNNEIIAAISENCLHIQYIDVTSSLLVTDESVTYLVECRELQEILLHNTSVSIAGYANLISQLPKLENVGRCNDFLYIMNWLDEPPYNNFKKINTKELETSTLSLLGSFFPKLESLSLFFDILTPDLRELRHLHCLKELKLVMVDQYLSSFNSALFVAGNKLVHLHLEFSEPMPFYSFISIGNNCPNLESLVFYGSQFEDDDRFSESISSKLKPQAFSKLESVFWDLSNCAYLLEITLSKAVQIEYIHVGMHTLFQHFNIVNILQVNPMKFLRDLNVWYSNSMNMQTVFLLLGSCPNLKVLSRLQRWRSITQAELIKFQDLIKTNNWELNINFTRRPLGPSCCESFYTLPSDF